MWGFGGGGRKVAFYFFIRFVDGGYSGMLEGGVQSHD